MNQIKTSKNNEIEELKKAAIQQQSFLKLQQERHQNTLLSEKQNQLIAL
jgi:hypothetical protein